MAWSKENLIVPRDVSRSQQLAAQRWPCPSSQSQPQADPARYRFQSQHSSPLPVWAPSPWDPTAQGLRAHHPQRWRPAQQAWCLSKPLSSSLAQLWAWMRLGPSPLPPGDARSRLCAPGRPCASPPYPPASPFRPLHPYRPTYRLLSAPMWWINEREGH